MILAYFAFKSTAPLISGGQLAINLISVFFYLRSVLYLFQVGPDRRAFDPNYTAAQILLTIGVVLLSMCLLTDRRPARWVDFAYLTCSLFVLVKAVSRLSSNFYAPSLTTIVIITVAAETMFLVTVLAVGISQLKHQEAEL